MLATILGNVIVALWAIAIFYMLRSGYLTAIGQKKPKPLPDGFPKAAIAFVLVMYGIVMLGSILLLRVL